MSKVVFVGNVPYNMSEDALIDIFKSAGEVVGFRLVFDRDTGKPRGYGFCEFADHETAMSAVRNLNGADCGGRPLRIDLADSDPFLEGKTTVRGEIVDAGDHHRPNWGRERDGPSRKAETGFLANLPSGTPIPPGTSVLDAISQTLGTMNPQQLIEVLAQMKAFVITHSEQARTLLSTYPQFSYALFQALLLNNIVDPAVAQRMLASTQSAGQPAPVPAPSYPPSVPPVGYPPVPLPGMQGPGPTPSAPMPGGMYQHPAPPPQQPVNGYYRPPPPVQPAVPPVAPPSATGTPTHPGAAVVDPDQRAMLMQVLSLTPEQIAAMPPTEQETIRMLRSQIMGTTGA